MHDNWCLKISQWPDLESPPRAGGGAAGPSGRSAGVGGPARRPPRAPRPGRPGGGEPRAGLDPKLYYPQGGLPECERGVYGGYRDSDGGRGGGARSRRGQGSRGAAKSPAALGGAGPGARSEPAATTRAYLLSERPGPGRGAGGGAHPGGSVVPSPFHCRRPQLRRRFRGVDGVGGREREGRGEARVVVTGDGEGGARRPEGARVRECGRRTEAGATTVARGGGGDTTRAEPRCAGAISGAGRRGRSSALAPALAHGLVSRRPLAPPCCVTGRG